MPVHRNLPAQFNERVHAFAIEMGTIFLAILIIVFMDWHPVLRFLFVFAGFYLVTLLPMFVNRGVSLGKHLSKIVITDLNNNPVSMTRAHVRELFKWTCGFLTIGLYFVVCFIVVSHRRDRRSIHDFVFKTKVVHALPRYS